MEVERARAACGYGLRRLQSGHGRIRDDAPARALAGPTVRRLLARAPARLADAVEWGDGRTVRGGDLTFVLARPISVDDNLPQAEFPPDAPATGDCTRPYSRSWLHERASGVTSIDVLVDLGRRAVVDVSTDARRGTLSWVPGKPHPDCAELPSG